MYHVSTQGVDECMINVHYYYVCVVGVGVMYGCVDVMYRCVGVMYGWHGCGCLPGLVGAQVH